MQTGSVGWLLSPASGASQERYSAQPSSCVGLAGSGAGTLATQYEAMGVENMLKEGQPSPQKKWVL